VVSLDPPVDCNEIGDTKLDVQYADGKLEKLCTDDREMRKKRADIADKLRRRIKALETATCLEELSTHDPLGNWHPLKANLDGHWAGKLSANYRLIVRPEDPPEAKDPTNPDDPPTPQRTVTVTVIDIDDYH
jgi:proteic killer suppression protein